jgi:transposase
MNGHGNRVVKMKGFAHVKTRICAKADQNRTGQNNSFDPQQRRCSYRTPCSNDLVVLSRQENCRDCRNVGHNRSHRFAYNSKFQYKGTHVSGGQTSQRPSSKDYRSLCEITERSCAKISAGFRLSIQFLDVGSIARISWAKDWYAAKSMLSISANGQRRDCISSSEARDGTFTKYQGLQREKGYFGVFKKRAVKRDAYFDLLYLDECEVHLHPTLTKVWTLKGTRPVVPAAGNNQRLCLYGAFNYKTGQVHYMSHPKKNSRRFAQFLSQLLSSDSEHFMVLVLDNASYHRTRKILDILTEHEDHVFVVWLPKYSPELNLIEGLWGYLKKSALNNYFYGDMASLEAAVDDAFRELQQHPETALSLAYRTSKNLRKSA